MRSHESSVGHGDLGSSRQAFFRGQRFLLLKALLQVLDDLVRYRWDFIPEMHQTADAIRMADGLSALLEIAAHEDITRKNRLNHAHRPTASGPFEPQPRVKHLDRKSTRLNSSHLVISYAVFCLKKKK